MFDRIWGKAAQAIELSGHMKIEKTAEELSDDELAIIVKSRTGG